MMGVQTQSEIPDILTIRDLADYLKCSRSMIDHVLMDRRRGKENDSMPPHFYIGSLPRFHREALQEWKCQKRGIDGWGI